MTPFSTIVLSAEQFAKFEDMVNGPASLPSDVLERARRIGRSVLADAIRARGKEANPISGTEPADGTVSPT